MKFKPALVAAAGVLALTLGATSAQAATPVAYSASGSYAASCSSDSCPASGADTFAYTGSASCSQNCVAGAPSDGTFQLSLNDTTRFHPPSPCVAKQVRGTLDVAWSDASTTHVSLSGSNRDHKGYVLSGTIDGGTSTFWPPGPFKGFVSHPPSPCNPGTFTGVLNFIPPNPV